MSNQIMELPAPLGPIFIRIALPFDEWSRFRVEAELATLVPFVKREEMDKFRRKLDWIPRTPEELARTKEIFAARGIPYHEAVAQAMGHDRCHCPDCE